MNQDIGNKNKRKGGEICNQGEKKRQAKMTGDQNKTPVTILQELCAKINPKDLPVYTELTEPPAGFGNSSFKFFYRCNALKVSAVGGGVTKKTAKHSTAERLLYKYDHKIDSDDDDMQAQTLEANSVTALLDYCTLKNYHKPNFRCIEMFGPSHDPSFTFECKLDSIRRNATAGNKPLAKKLAAKAVLDILKMSFPNSEKKVAVVTNTKTVSEKIREKITSYMELKKQGKVESMGTMIKERHNFFRKQDEDFCQALVNILTSSDSEDEKYEQLVKELKTMWPDLIDPFTTENFFAETEFLLFEVPIDYEVFTCVLIGSREQLKGEVLQYFNAMLTNEVSEPETSDNDENFGREIVFEPL